LLGFALVGKAFGVLVEDVAVEEVAVVGALPAVVLLLLGLRVQVLTAALVGGSEVGEEVISLLLLVLLVTRLELTLLLLFHDGSFVAGGRRVDVPEAVVLLPLSQGRADDWPGLTC